MAGVEQTASRQTPGPEGQPVAPGSGTDRRHCMGAARSSSVSPGWRGDQALSKRGGLTVYLYDPGRRFAYHCAHLERDAPGLREGQLFKRCELLGYVGNTGTRPPTHRTCNLRDSSSKPTRTGGAVPPSIRTRWCATAPGRQRRARPSANEVRVPATLLTIIRQEVFQCISNVSFNLSQPSLPA